MTNAGDRVLAERLARGEEDAFLEVFRANHDAVRGVIFRVAGPVRDLEDLVQTTFLEVYRSCGSYRGDCPLRSWIRGVAVRVALHGIRSARRAARVVLVEAPDGPAEGADPHAAYVADLRLQRLRTALDRLDPDKRAVVVLHEVEALDVAEVAKVLGLSVAAAKSRLLRGRAELARLAREDHVLAELLAEGVDEG